MPDEPDLGELDDDYDDEALATSGWDAIDEALEQVYAAQRPRHYGTLLRYALGGPDPVDGISVYPCDSPRPHWHYVTYGFSELYEKLSGRAALSGWGFELTLRLARGPEHDPPSWPLRVFQTFGRHVFGQGDPFGVGDVLDGDLTELLGQQSTGLSAFALCEDPLLPPRDTPNGRLTFLQLVGLTMDEVETVAQWETLPFLEIVAEQHPLLITDLSRDSVLADEAAFRAIRDAQAR
jgi:suppressor of fused-like protein